MNAKTMPRELEWIGSLPVGYKVQRLGLVASHVKNRNTNLANKNLLTLSYGELKRKSIDASDGLLPESYETYNVINKNDVVLRLTDLQNDKNSLRSALSHDAGIITSAYVTIRPQKIDPKFLAYYLRALDQVKVFYSLGSGLRQSLGFDEVKQLPVIMPPLDEQRRIADYLDHETAEIDALLSDTESLSNLQLEHLSGTIEFWTSPKSNKDESWKETTLRRLVDINEGQVSPGIPPFNSMVLIAPNHIKSRTGQIIKFETAVDQAADSGKYLARAGQVIFSKIRPTLMKSTIAPFDCLCSGDMYAITSRSQYLTNAYLLEFLLSPAFEAYAATESARVAMPKLNRETFGSAPINLPPISHQLQAVEAISVARSKVLDSLNETTRVQGLLRERRAALISAAVTGQITV